MMRGSVSEKIRGLAARWSNLVYRMQFPWWYHLSAVTLMCCALMFSAKDLLISLVMSIGSRLLLTDESWWVAGSVGLASCSGLLWLLPGHRSTVCGHSLSGRGVLLTKLLFGPSEQVSWGRWQGHLQLIGLLLRSFLSLSILWIASEPGIAGSEKYAWVLPPLWVVLVHICTFHPLPGPLGAWDAGLTSISSAPCSHRFSKAGWWWE